MGPFAKAFTACALLLLAACDDDLPKISLISEMDIFGLRTEVQGEPARATPAGGETAEVTLSLVYPELGDHDGELSIAVLECTFPERFIGAPVCQEFIDGLSMGSGESDVGAAFDDDDSLRCTNNLTLAAGPLTLRCLSGKRTFDLPIARSGADSRLLLGIVCRNGIATIGTDDGQPGFSCVADKDAAGKLEEELFSAKVSVQQDEVGPNRNPSMDGVGITLDGAPWTEFAGGTPQETDCDGTATGLPQLEPGEEVDLRFDIEASQREKVDGEWETLRLSHRATTGELERSASYIPPDRTVNEDGKLSVDLAWTAPRRDEYEHRLIEFHLGLRDGRGGFVAGRRFACLR